MRFRLPRQEVGDGKGSVFFIRYTLLKTRWGGLYLHRFYRSDGSRCLHDHPWPFVTLILRGGYFEELANPSVPVGGMPVWRPPGYCAAYPAQHKHRITLAPDGPKPWSLVLVGRKERAWGFQTATGWVPWKKGDPDPICEVKP